MDWNKFKIEFISERYRRVQEEIKLQNPSLEYLRKGQEKRSKEKQFEEKVKTSFLPKIDPRKQETLSSAISG